MSCLQVLINVSRPGLSGRRTSVNFDRYNYIHNALEYVLLLSMNAGDVTSPSRYGYKSE